MFIVRNACMHACMQKKKKKKKKKKEEKCPLCLKCLL